MSGFVVDVRVVAVVKVAVTVVIKVFIVVVEEENEGEMVCVKLASVTVVKTDSVRSFSNVVIKSILSCIVVITAAVVIAPVTTKNINITFVRIRAFLFFPEPS